MKALLLVLLACQGQEGAGPEPGLARIPLLRAPFEGERALVNPFDHRPGPRPPGHGEVLDRFGGPALGTRGHRGIDWDLPAGTPVLAPAAGAVVGAGPVAPFYCALAGREVDDQLAVEIEHVGPDGSRWRTESHHLSRVDVRPGDAVTAGQIVGLSGASGCAEGAHLHFVVSRVLAEGRVPVDPFGWRPGGPDPWSEANGLSPAWLWRDGAAPPWRRERADLDVGAAGPVALRRVRFQVLPGDVERVEVVGAPAGAAAEGWSLRVRGREIWRGRLQDAVDLRADALPDAGALLELVDPSGAVVHGVTWGLASRRGLAPEDEAPSCPDGRGCVPLPVGGPPGEPVWSPDGRRLAVTVGSVGRRRLVLGEVVEGRLDLGVVTLDEALPGAADAARPGWLSPDVVVFEATDADGHRRPAYAIPGARGGQLLPPTTVPGDLAVRGASRGLVLLAAGDPADLLLWSVGAGEPASVSRDRRDEVLADLAPDLRHAVVARAGEVIRLELATGASTLIAPGVFDPAELRAWGQGAVWRVGERWAASAAGGAVPLDPAGPAAVAGDDLVVWSGGALARWEGAGWRTLASATSTRPERIAVVAGPFGWRWAAVARRDAGLALMWGEAAR